MSIIDISTGVTNARVETLDFDQVDSQAQSLRERGVRLYPNRKPSRDLEPEDVAINPHGTEARVVLQEQNALAEVDLRNHAPTGIQALDTTDYATAGQGLDATSDGKIKIRNHPIKGLYQPDQMGAYAVGGETYYVTANEGDGEIEELVSFGARSFAIWDSAGNRVFKSGSEFAEIQTERIPTGCNSDDEANTLDAVSNEASPEVEGMVRGRINGAMHAFVGLGKPGGVMVYNIATPENARFVAYFNNRVFELPLQDPDGTPNTDAGDSGPEGVALIPRTASAIDAPMLATGNEISGSVTLWAFATR